MPRTRAEGGAGVIWRGGGAARPRNPPGGAASKHGATGTTRSRRQRPDFDQDGLPMSQGRIAPVEELVNTFEVEAMAQRKLDNATYAEIAGSDRKAFDRITFRPRMMV